MDQKTSNDNINLNKVISEIPLVISESKANIQSSKDENDEKIYIDNKMLH